MTLANIEQHRYIPWFAKAGAACSIVPISRFVGSKIFALKGGGYGCLFSLAGIDEEGLTDLELDSRIRSIEGALRGLPEGSCLYQYTRVMSGFHLPRHAKYENPATEVFATDRLSFLEKSAGFRRIDLHWCLTLEPLKVKAFERRPHENALDTSRMLADLEKTAVILESHLGNSLGLRFLDKGDSFQFFSYLFNLEEWSEHDQLRSDTGVDRQIVKSPVAWHSDHLQVGKRHVQMFSLKTTPEASRPCLFSGLFSLDCNSVLCSSWRVKSASAARSEIDAQEKFISFFKVGVLTRVMSGHDTVFLETGARAKAANSNVDDLSEVIRDLDKKAQGEFSLRLLLAARSTEQLRDTVPAVHRIFVDARAQIMEETLGNLSAFYAMFPGNHKFNVFPLWLAEDHHARLSSVFAPHLGHPRSEDLDSEYLNIFETRTRTPFFQDVYVDGVRVMLIIGPTGTGKSVHGNQIISLEQKYGGFTYIFDIGGSYESVVELYGGRVDRVGKDGPRVNPFALEPTESNIKFLYSFVKLLLTNGGAELEPEDDDVIHKAVQDRYREKRTAQGRTHATVNRELSIMRTAFHNARKRTPPKVTVVPYFPMVKETTVRTGFLTDQQYSDLRDTLDPELKALYVSAYVTGIRKGELTPIQWPQVDFETDLINLDSDKTKTGEGRTVPIVKGDMRDFLVAAKKERDERWPDSPWVFNREGRQIIDFRISWANACKKAGVPDLKFHDLRRTAVRNMRRAGVPQVIRMKISGHKTDSMERRYNIVDADDLNIAKEFMERRMMTAKTVTKV